MSADTLRNENPTFGVEIEFLIATLNEDDEDPHAHVKGIPPVLRVPQFKDADDYTHGKVREVLDECFGLPPRSSIGSSKPLTTLDTYKKWNVGTDASLIPPSGNEQYYFVPVEIASPVQYASPKGFDAINFAISTITSRFRCVVNPSCGIHVHVGLGASRLPLEHVRRMSSLSYAVEPLLFTLQHPARSVNLNCCQPRHYSYFVHDGPETDPEIPHNDPSWSNKQFGCIPLGRERRHGEASLVVREPHDNKLYVNAFMETREAGHYEPFTKYGDTRHTTLLSSDIVDEINNRISAVQLPSLSPTAPSEPTRQREIPRLRLKKYDEATIKKLNKENEPWGASLLSTGIALRIASGDGPGVFEATECIYSQPSSCYIGKLLSNLNVDRSSMSFHNYRCWYASSPVSSPRTIEVRIAEGSLDGNWIATWAKIVTGLFRFALHSSPSDFIDVMTNCERATKIDGSYDIVDLLDDIGLFAEAVAVEKRLKAHERAWDMKFVEPEA
ncbi:putative amidoligase enzyme-domain-containing protein [Xylaria curta]|nr:putative amidoligase enzyme-domain-containing protein [Xylaria curta]